MNPAPIAARLLRACALGAALAVLATLPAAPAPAAPPRFDLRADDQPLFRSKWMADRHHVPQSFAFDDAHRTLYVLQVEGSNAAGTHDQHAARGDLVLTRMTADGERVTGHMILRGFGHGVSLGVEPAADAVYLWTEVDSDASRGVRLGRFVFTDGATLGSASPAIRKFDLLPGARVCTPSLDLTHGRMAMKYVGADHRGHVALFDFAAVLAGHSQPLHDMRLPAGLGVLQGWCTYGDFVYILSGEAYGPHNPPPGNATLWCLAWTTGALVDRQPCHAFATLVYREPEGLAVQPGKGGARLCYGFGSSVSVTDVRRQLSIAWKPLLQPATP